MRYNPPRQLKPLRTDDPLEIELVFNVRACGTCTFFWPSDPARQPYGPYSAYDFESNTPTANSPPPGATQFQWLNGVTRPPTFPTGQVMDGCRKAPIMTIGINPNLTAFAPGQTGASWCYPDFSNDNNGDAWTKYAYYYRYRSVYQEHFNLAFIKKYLLSDQQIVAPRPGVVVSANRSNMAPQYVIDVRYEGDTADTAIPIPGKIGNPEFVLLFDVHPPHNRFAKGDILAAKLSVPGGQQTPIIAQQVGYYEQFQPTLSAFESFLEKQGHSAVQLHIGEDVCQLDMVACASPHWGSPWLGGSSHAERTIIQNCVGENAWSIKQLVQTQPAVLFLVGQASYNMFAYSLGHLLRCTPPLPRNPEDGAFTLLRQTSDPAHTCSLEFNTTIDGISYALSTRIVVTPHFSYDANFVPQFRLSPSEWNKFQQNFKACADFLEHDARIIRTAPSADGAYLAFAIKGDEQVVLREISINFASAKSTLMANYCDAHGMMTGVLQQLYQAGKLSYVAESKQNGGFLSRNDGPCSFCTNKHWKFPQGCPYGKPDEKPYPAGFLDKVAQAMIQSVTAESRSLRVIPQRVFEVENEVRQPSNLARGQ